MSPLSVLAGVVLGLGVGGLVLAAPGRHWDRAMGRLRVRIRQDLTTLGHDRVAAGADGAPQPLRPELPEGGSGPRPETPSSFVDRSIDRFIDVLRSTIGTRAFPRAVALVVGAVLVLLAVLLFALAPSGGGGGESNDEGLHGGPPPTPRLRHAGAVAADRGRTPEPRQPTEL